MMTTFTDGANLLNRKSQKMHDFTISYKVRGVFKTSMMELFAKIGNE